MQPNKPKFNELVKIAIDYVHDNELLENKIISKALFAESGNDVPKGVCRNYGTAKGCNRNPCPWRHLDNGKKEGSTVTDGKENKETKKKSKQCYGCGSFDHMLSKCPKYEEYSKIQSSNPVLPMLPDYPLIL